MEQSDVNATLDRLQELDLGALKAFVGLCDRYKLRYYAIGGTLLGAVRHKGFIPWDDDVDVAMPRKDYDCLLSLLEQGEAGKVMGEDYRIESWQTEESFRSYFAKVAPTRVEIQERVLEGDTEKKGYLIDIFPIDGTPDGALRRRLYFGRAMWLRFLCGTANVPAGINQSRPKWEQTVLRIVRTLQLHRFLKIKKIYGRMDRLFRGQDAETAKYVGTLTGAYKTREIVPRAYFGTTYDECSYVEFEGVRLRGPKEYDAYLTHIYGAYQTLPPQEERKVHYMPCIRQKIKEEEESVKEEDE